MTFQGYNRYIISRTRRPRSRYRAFKSIVLYITKVAQSTVKQLINIAPTIPCSYPFAASKPTVSAPSFAFFRPSPNGVERTHPHNKFLTHLFRSITLHPRWPPRSSLIGWGKGWSQGSVRGLGGWPVAVWYGDAGGGWKQWRHLSSVALARRNIRQDKLRDLPGSWTFLANCIRISTLHPHGLPPLYLTPLTAPTAPMELELTRINHLRGSVRVRKSFGCVSTPKLKFSLVQYNVTIICIFIMLY